MVCFVVGFAGTGVSIALGFLPGVFICYGAIMGIGLGVGYLTPVKTGSPITRASPPASPSPASAWPRPSPAR